MILDTPGTRADDASIGNHADVLVLGENAYIFYFTHPPRPKDRPREAPVDPRLRYTFIQVARLHRSGDTLVCDRDETFDFLLPNPYSGE
jgi:hypothetical protein